MLEKFVGEVTNFLQINRLLNVWHSGDWAALQGLDWLLLVAAPAIPLLLVIEFVVTAGKRKADYPTYWVNLLIYVANRVLGLFINLAVAFSLVAIVQQYAFFQTSVTWYWFIYAYLVWELAHYFYHYLCHNVRLLWCLHSSHHAPRHMNLSVSYAHFFLEGAFANLIRVPLSILMGVDPQLLGILLVIAPVYGSFIHIGEAVLPKGRLGLAEKIFLSPADHRVHHAKNPLYMDRNYCNLFKVWDWLFGTYQPPLEGIPVEYGITRPVNTASFFDVYCGEITFLMKDVIGAPGLKNKILYLLMPPGWDHRGQHKTARFQRKRFLAALAMPQSPIDT